MGSEGGWVAAWLSHTCACWPSPAPPACRNATQHVSAQLGCTAHTGMLREVSQAAILGFTEVRGAAALECSGECAPSAPAGCVERACAGLHPTLPCLPSAPPCQVWDAMEEAGQVVLLSARHSTAGVVRQRCGGWQGGRAGNAGEQQVDLLGGLRCLHAHERACAACPAPVSCRAPPRHRTAPSNPSAGMGRMRRRCRCTP